MQLITKKELAGKVIMQGRATIFRINIMKLEVGQILQINRTEWKPRNSPSWLVSSIKSQTGRQFIFHVLRNEGWAIERIK